MNCAVCNSANSSAATSCLVCGATLHDSSNASHDSDAFAAGTLLGKGTYRVERVLGQGGFGITYCCRDLVLDRAVAVKEFFPFGCQRRGVTLQPSRALSHFDYSEAKTRFLNEARILARCHHVGIVNVHTAFEENNTAYMVMELLVGKSLAVLLQERGGVMPEGEAVGYIERVGDALHFVHELDLLHRDLKPENVIVCNDGRVMLIDFGTAKEYSKGQVQGHTVVVTPGYAPLEQYAQQAKRGPFTDVYGLAATLYHLLTGEVPIAASDRAMGVLLAPARELNPQVSRVVAQAVEAGLQIEVAKRPQSVRAFLRALAGEELPNTRAEVLDLSMPADDTYKNPYVIGQSSVDRALVDFADMIKERQQLWQSAQVAPDQVNSLVNFANTVTAQQSSPQTFPASQAQVTSTLAASFAGAAQVAPTQPQAVPLATTAASQGGTVVAQPKSNLPAILVVGFILIVGALRLTSPRQPPEPYFPHGPNGENLIISPPPPFSAPPTSGSTAVASNMSWMRPLAAEQRRLEQASIETGPYIVSPERRPIILQDQDINGAKFSRDAKLLAIISTNKQDSTNAKASAATPEATSKVHLWDVEKRQFRRSFDLNRKLSYTSTPYAFSDDLHWFGVNGQDTTTLWNLRTGKLERTWKRKPATLSGTAAQGGTSFYPSPGQLLFLRDGRMATIRREIRQSYSSNPTITYWITFYDIKSGHQSQSQLSHPNLSGFPEMFSGYTPHWETISPDGKDLLTFLEAGKVTRLSIAEKGKLSSSPVQIPPQNRGMHTPLKDPFYPFLPHAIQYSPSGRFLTTLALNGTVNLYSAGREVSRLLPSYNLAFASDRMTISFSPDEELLALSRPDGMIGKGICLWSTDDSKFIQFLPLMVDPIAFVVDNDRVISIDDTGQICTWQRKSADLLQQAPKSLMTSYNAWKKAHAAPKADALLAFYSPQTRFDGMFKEYDYNKFRQLLMASQTDNWSRVTDTRSPMITKSDQGWVMHCSLDYKDGWGLKHARSGRRLVWAQSGGAWRIIEDEVGPYDTTTPTRVATSQATER